MVGINIVKISNINPLISHNAGSLLARLGFVGSERQAVLFPASKTLPPTSLSAPLMKLEVFLSERETRRHTLGVR